MFLCGEVEPRKSRGSKAERSKGKKKSYSSGRNTNGLSKEARILLSMICRGPNKQGWEIGPGEMIQILCGFDFFFKNVNGKNI